MSSCLVVCNAHAATVPTNTSPKRKWLLISRLLLHGSVFGLGQPAHDLPDRLIVCKYLPHGHTAVTHNSLPGSRRLPTVCSINQAILGERSSHSSKDGHNGFLLEHAFNSDPVIRNHRKVGLPRVAHRLSAGHGASQPINENVILVDQLTDAVDIVSVDPVNEYRDGLGCVHVSRPCKFESRSADEIIVRRLAMN